MGKKTEIGWCDATFSPWRGCQKISKGCENCYADTFSRRNPKLLGVFGTEAQGGTRVVASDDMWQQPLKWNKAAALLPESIVKPYSQPVEYIKVPRPRVFCASIADVFEDWSGPMLNHKGLELAVCHGCDKVDTVIECIDCGGSHDLCSRMPRRLTMNDVRRRLFDLIDKTPNLTWQLLTKRPENIRRMWSPKRHYADQYPDDPYPNAIAVTGTAGLAYHRANTWIGTTVENQGYADKRIPELLKCSDVAPVLFLSMEPLLGPVDLANVNHNYQAGGYMIDAVKGLHGVSSGPHIGWVIAGCESGAHRRETKLEWVRDLRDQCKAAGVAFFVKQLQIDGNVTTDINQFPEDLRIQEFPNQ